MLKQVIKPTQEIYNLHIPKEYINRKIEITISLYEDEKTEKHIEDTDLFSITCGILKDKNIDPIKWQREIRDDREISY